MMDGTGIILWSLALVAILLNMAGVLPFTQ